MLPTGMLVSQLLAVEFDPNSSPPSVSETGSTLPQALHERRSVAPTSDALRIFFRRAALEPDLLQRTEPGNRFRSSWLDDAQLRHGAIERGVPSARLRAPTNLFKNPE
jgi:hypothetical protein